MLCFTYFSSLVDVLYLNFVTVSEDLLAMFIGDFVLHSIQDTDIFNFYICCQVAEH